MGYSYAAATSCRAAGSASTGVATARASRALVGLDHIRGRNSRTCWLVWVIAWLFVSSCRVVLGWDQLFIFGVEVSLDR